MKINYEIILILQEYQFRYIFAKNSIVMMVLVIFINKKAESFSASFILYHILIFLINF
uniref:Uncharacterized protein n=1 Tax=uncultured Sphingobacteriales bacterium HF0130_33B19 TaxID=710991 RepID=E0XTQ8_9SPHI|nr:hypothetical protein [uncultured Sphingobacteriales bacterium HF0130_33B19]